MLNDLNDFRPWFLCFVEDLSFFDISFNVAKCSLMLAIRCWLRTVMSIILLFVMAFRVLTRFCRDNDS